MRLNLQSISVSSFFHFSYLLGHIRALTMGNSFSDVMKCELLTNHVNALCYFTESYIML